VIKTAVPPGAVRSAVKPQVPEPHGAHEISETGMRSPDGVSQRIYQLAEDAIRGDQLEGPGKPACDLSCAMNTTLDIRVRDGRSWRPTRHRFQLAAEIEACLPMNRAVSIDILTCDSPGESVGVDVDEVDFRLRGEELSKAEVVAIAGPQNAKAGGGGTSLQKAGYPIAMRGESGPCVRCRGTVFDLDPNERIHPGPASQTVAPGAIAALLANSASDCRAPDSAARFSDSLRVRCTATKSLTLRRTGRQLPSL
jgi:hypothetical protein